MHTATRAALTHALAQLSPELAMAPAGCRSLRRAILTAWPAPVPRPTRTELVDGIRSLRRAEVTARIDAVIHQTSDIGGSS